MIEEQCGLVIEHFLADILALKVARYGQHLSVANPANFAANASGEAFLGAHLRERSGPTKAGRTC